MAAGISDERHDDGAGTRDWSSSPPTHPVPFLPNDRLGFAGSGLFGLGALLVAAPPKPEPVPEPAPEPGQQAPQPQVAEAEPQASLANPEVPDGEDAAASQPAQTIDAPAQSEQASPEAEAEPERSELMPGLFADLNRRMHGIEQRLDITLLEIEQATRELREAARDQREAAEMLRAMHAQRNAPRDERSVTSGIRPASLAASDLVPPASAKIVAPDARVIALAEPISPEPVREEARLEAADPAQPETTTREVSLPEAPEPEAPEPEAPQPEAASSADETDPAPIAQAPAPPEPTWDPPAQEPAQPSRPVSAYGVSPEKETSVPHPARGLRWLVAALILIAFIVWLLGPGRGYLGQAFDPRAWGATFGWASQQLDQAHGAIVDWSDALRRVIRG